MHRAFFPHLNFSEKTFSLSDPEEIHHLRNVLRLQAGDRVILFNGKGQEVLASIVSMTPLAISFQAEKINSAPEKKAALVLACAIPKKAKFELIIEKCTELGIDEIIPLKTKRTEFKLSADNAQKKGQRYERVAVNAAKQSNRKTIPYIHPVTKFSDAFQLAGQGASILIPCLFGQRKSIWNTLNGFSPESKKIVVFIGPEGDFTDDEVQLAVHNGAIPVSLGPTTLKVDTAAFAAIAALNFYFHADE